MINRWVECFWRSRCYLDGLCALPLAILRLANMFRLTSALLLQLWALAAFGQDFFVSTNTEYERLQLVWSAVFTAECLNSWLPLNVWQVISEAEDTGGKNPLTCFGVDSGKFGLQWFNVVALSFFFVYTEYEYYYDYVTEIPAVDLDTTYDDWIYELLDITGT